MGYHVRQTDEAHQDLANILEWLLEKQAGETGLRWLDRLQEAMGTLSEYPQRCGLAPESKEFGFEVRHLIYGRKPHIYRVLFTVEDEAVVILNIRHGRRLPVTPN
jgi:plasmid stabilization system protein ParE